MEKEIEVETENVEKVTIMEKGKKIVKAIVAKIKEYPKSSILVLGIIVGVIVGVIF